ncbi:hypothetical protein TOK_4773 [Pseudonocardia sp. N23]|nr:hypothetical protein TOK_4773 [Pseudonocardia sp. N23]
MGRVVAEVVVDVRAVVEPLVLLRVDVVVAAGSGYGCLEVLDVERADRVGVERAAPRLRVVLVVVVLLVPVVVLVVLAVLVVVPVVVGVPVRAASCAPVRGVAVVVPVVVVVVGCGSGGTQLCAVASCHYAISSMACWDSRSWPPVEP